MNRFNFDQAAGTWLPGRPFGAGGIFMQACRSQVNSEKERSIMKRRTFLGAVVVTPLVMAGVACDSSARPAATASEQEVEAMRRDWKALLAPGADVTLSTEPLRRSAAARKKTLNP